VRSGGILEFGQIPDHGDSLHRLSQTHLICKDSADAVGIKFDKPVQAFELVLPQNTVLEH
jgi:hypothetical protein